MAASCRRYSSPSIVTPRLLRRGRAVAALVWLLVALSGCSGGSSANDPEQIYLDALHKSQYGNFGKPDGELISQGHWACGQIRDGATPQSVAARLSDMNQISDSAASFQVDAATSNICPDRT